MIRYISIPILAALILLAGCASLWTPSKELHISAVLVDPDSLVLVGFSNIGYSEQQVLVRVTGPADLQNEVLAIRFVVAWGRKVTSYGDLKKWQKPIGSTVQFSVHRKDITNEWPRENRRIYANRLRDILWPSLSASKPLSNMTVFPDPPNQALEPTRPTVTPAGRVAHL